MINRISKKIKNIFALRRFKKDFAWFAAQNDKRLPVLWEDRFPCLDDATAETPFDAHYIYHPAWAARILSQTKPVEHVDIASTLHFASLVSAFVPVQFYDYRPAKLSLSNLTSRQADLTKLPFGENTIASLSCMHTVEHIGLGRYGDALDPTGDLKAISELKRVLSVGGDLLFVVPVGRPRVQFNAHRVYAYEDIKKYFADFELKDFSLVLDDGSFVPHADPSLVARQAYGCGCFWFKKKV